MGKTRKFRYRGKMLTFRAVVTPYKNKDLKAMEGEARDYRKRGYKAKISKSRKFEGYYELWVRSPVGKKI